MKTVYLTVNKNGIRDGSALLRNNGSDFGPDTPGTTTGGFAEALYLANQLQLANPSIRVEQLVHVEVRYGSDPVPDPGDSWYVDAE
jgi:hypothetical protein